MINWKEFKKKLIDDDLSAKKWCQDNDFDIDRFRNVQYGIVKPTHEELLKINNYLGGGDE